MTRYVRTLNRRTALKWFGAALASEGFAYGCSSDSAVGQRVAATSDPPVPTALGYGTDPDMNNPMIPWPNTLTGTQLDTLAALCDLLLPAKPPHPSASQCAVPEFIDEWVSAPYPDQIRDRGTILRGIEWVQEQARSRAQVDFGALSLARQSEIFELLVIDRSSRASHTDLTAFCHRFRWLVFSAYYTSPAGEADLQFLGERPVTGDYPGPTPEAVRHIENALRELGIRAAWDVDSV